MERRRWFGRQVWYSICSAHMEPLRGCGCCEVGHWRTTWVSAIGSAVFRLSPRVWRWWANLSFNRRRWKRFATLDGGEANPFPNLK